MFVFQLINLFNAYILSFLHNPDFVLLTGNKCWGMKTLCVVKKLIHTFLIHVFLFVCVLFLFFSFGFCKKRKKKTVLSFNCIYGRVTLRSAVSCLIRCVVVTARKLIFIQRVSKSWQKKKKREKQSQKNVAVGHVLSCETCCHLLHRDDRGKERKC